ncbi:hypothetical protein XENOCAPTIV_006240 [Xenoophorus captivus]|uniref:Centrosomal protein 57kDa-like protein 1 n=1 Tax=Xenoophorus captivus TaxID=1517983 RepID=A0ABV0S2X6_9TELE
MFAMRIRRRLRHLFLFCYKMETHHKILDSPSKNSYIGSYYQPPDRILSVSKHQESPALSPLNMNQTTSCLSQTTRNIDSKAVVDALRTLQEKIRRLELERRQAERSYVQFSQDAQTSQHNMASHSRTEAILPGTEVDLKLQSAEARCRVLEKQLDYMRKMTKLAILEQKLLKEEHELHANVQSILHMMKHHQPQLCERVSALQRSGCGVKKNLQNEFSDADLKPASPPSDQSLTLLSDLLLALQEELGQMSFEYQDLERQTEATREQEQREDLQTELERLAAKMEEKGDQITKLRKHQQMVHKLSQSQRHVKEETARKLIRIKPPVPSPVRGKQKAGRRGTVNQNNLQLLRETQKFRNSLKQDDVSWET